MKPPSPKLDQLRALREAKFAGKTTPRHSPERLRKIVETTALRASAPAKSKERAMKTKKTKPAKKTAKAKKANPKPAKTAAAAKPASEKKTGEVRPGTKLELVVNLLKRPEGCTTAEVLKATGWPAVSMPQQAKAAGLKLSKEKDGKVSRYRAA